MIPSCYCTGASEDAGIYKMFSDVLSRGQFKKSDEWHLHAFYEISSPELGIWSTIHLCLHTSKEHWSDDSFGQEQQAVRIEISVWNMKEMLEPWHSSVCGFVSFIRLILFYQVFICKKRRTYSLLSVKTATRSLNLYSMCTRRLTSIVPRSIHLGAWITFCREHMQLMKTLIWWRAQMTTKQMH